MSHWNALRQAFGPRPDLARVYPATRAEQGLARLQTALDEGESFALLTGPAGTGKTLLAYRLLEALGPQRRTILVTNSHLPDRAALLQTCLFDLGLPHEGKSEQELRLSLTAHLFDSIAERGSVILVLDEAHLLAPDLLEELRLLANLEAAGQPALQVVLIGLPVLRDELDQPDLAALAQRVSTRLELPTLDVSEAIDYLAHLLRTTGPRGLDVVPEEIHEMIAVAGQGVCRRINQILRETLRVAQECEADVVDLEMVSEALARLGLGTPHELEIRFDPEPDEGPLAA